MTVLQKRSRRRLLDDWVQTLSPVDFITTDHRLNPTVVTRQHHDWSDSDRIPTQLRHSELITDENHASELKNFKSFQFTGDVGGEMSLLRAGVLADGSEMRIHMSNDPHFPNQDFDYIGPAFAIEPTSVPSITPPILRDLGPIGTHAIAEVKPTNNVANLATDLFEVKQTGLPHLIGAHLWKDKTLTARAAGAEYLNKEFGWDPLVSDIRGASYAAANAHKILSSYERNSHKMVRRRYEFPIEQSEVWSTWQSNARVSLYFPDAVTALINQFVGGQGSILRCRRTYRRTWFSGAFTYHLPIGYNSRNKLISSAAKAGPLLGIELTPETVWAATPWTWALDWVSNVGDVVSIMSDMAVDGLVIKYGYVMEHQVTSDTYYWSGPYGLRPTCVVSGSPPIVTSYIETKRRKRATPFGFEIGWEGLSLRQLAISAALGLTRWI